jgi:hypothetical protein
MIARCPEDSSMLRLAAAAALLVGAAALSGCAGLGDSVASQAFVDPAKYDLYDCKRLEGERKGLAARIVELDRLIAKAETGVGGAVVAEVAYRNDYIAARGQQRLAEQAWRSNRCDEGGAAAASPNAAAPNAPSRSGSAVY